VYSDDGQRNCPKHVEFYFKNKFEKLVHLVGFVIRIYHDARSPERQTDKYVCTSPGRKTYNRIGYFLMLASGRWHSRFTLALRGASGDADRHVVVTEVAVEESEKPNNIGFQ